jgi:hypothetical protein
LREPRSPSRHPDSPGPGGRTDARCESPTALQVCRTWFSRTLARVTSPHLWAAETLTTHKAHPRSRSVTPAVPPPGHPVTTGRSSHLRMTRSSSRSPAVNIRLPPKFRCSAVGDGVPLRDRRKCRSGDGSKGAIAAPSDSSQPDSSCTPSAYAYSTSTGVRPKHKASRCATARTRPPPRRGDRSRLAARSVEQLDQVALRVGDEGHPHPRLR